MNFSTFELKISVYNVIFSHGCSKEKTEDIARFLQHRVENTMTSQSKSRLFVISADINQTTQFPYVNNSTWSNNLLKAVKFSHRIKMYFCIYTYKKKQIQNKINVSSKSQREFFQPDDDVPFLNSLFAKTVFFTSRPRRPAYMCILMLKIDLCI